MGAIAQELVIKLAKTSHDDKRVYRLVEYIGAKIEPKIQQNNAARLDDKLEGLRALVSPHPLPVRHLVDRIFADASAHISLLAAVKQTCKMNSHNYRRSSHRHHKAHRMKTLPRSSPVVPAAAPPTPSFDMLVNASAGGGSKPASGRYADAPEPLGGGNKQRATAYLREAQRLSCAQLQMRSLRYMTEKIDVHLSVLDNQLRLTNKVAELDLGRHLLDPTKQRDVYEVFAEMHKWMYLCQGLKLRQARKDWSAAGSGSQNSSPSEPFPPAQLSTHGLPVAGGI